jgi:hypothetical protein
LIEKENGSGDQLDRPIALLAPSRGIDSQGLVYAGSKQ